MLLHDLGAFANTIKRHRRQGWGWRYDGLEDWPTERIFAQLRELHIDTDAQRFPEQAAAAGRFETLDDAWVEQIPPEQRKSGFWEDFPLMATPVLWERLAPKVVCADLIEERLYRVLKAEDEGEDLPAVNGLPADVAAALQLANFLVAAEPSQRADRFNEVNAAKYYDYTPWLMEVIELRGSEYPDAATQIADAMSDCCQRDRFQGELAVVLAMAGRGEEAIARTRANLAQFPGNLSVRILAGDTFEELGDEGGAIRLWLEAISRACTHDDWEAAMERLEETMIRRGREGEIDAILGRYPKPAPEPDETLLDWPMERSAALAEPPGETGDFPHPAPIKAGKKIGRNEPCPCGSGKKYKKCCLNK